MSTNDQKHTPGPWRFDGIEDGEMRLSAESWGWFARVCIEVDEAPSNEGQANARLIAAAPDLLAALEMADKWESDGRPDGVQHLIARLRATLAKARGEA